MAQNTGNPPTPPKGEQEPELNRAASSLVNWLGIGLTFLALLLAYLFASIWPSGFNEQTNGGLKAQVCLLWISSACGTFTADVQLLLMVMVAGALGSFIHTATSFTDFVGNRQLARSWMWWYLLKPFIGMALAVIVYLVVRGGFLSVSASAGTLNIYGLAAMSAMAGLFSKQATDKLNEVFNTLFRTGKGGGDEKRKDDLENVAPTSSDVQAASGATSEHEDGCEVEVSQATPDESLPPAVGGVSKA